MTKLLGLPILASKQGADVDLLIILLHVLMGVLFAGWGGYFLYTIWRFRQSRSPKADYVGVTSHSSSWLEVAVAFCEGVLLLGFAVPLWAKAVDEFPKESESTVIRVTARQFNWMARYPGTNGIFGKQDYKLVTKENPLGVIAKDPKAKDQDPSGADDVFIEGGDIAVPVDKPVIIFVTSLDVIHSFKLLTMRVTQDAIPGMMIPLHFTPTLTNTYQLNCAQLCGNGHSNMKGIFRVLGQPEYDVWIKAKAGAVPVSYE